MAVSKPSQPTDALQPMAFRVEEARRMIAIGKSKLDELMASGDLAKVKIGKVTQTASRPGSAA